MKENIYPSYSESCRIPIQLLLLINEKLKKMVTQGILEHVLKGGSNCVSPIVVLRKADEDLRIWGDYKIGVNYKICSESFPIPKIEIILHALVGTKYFTKTDLKLAYNQIQINEKFKEVTTINTPLGLLCWICMLYRIKIASFIF